MDKRIFLLTCVYCITYELRKDLAKTALYNGARRVSVRLSISIFKIAFDL